MLRVVIFIVLSGAAGWFWLAADRFLPAEPAYGQLALVLCAVFLLIAGILAAVNWRRQIADKMHFVTLGVLIAVWLLSSFGIIALLWRGRSESPVSFDVSRSAESSEASQSEKIRHYSTRDRDNISDAIAELSQILNQDVLLICNDGETTALNLTNTKDFDAAIASLKAREQCFQLLYLASTRYMPSILIINWYSILFYKTAYTHDLIRR